MMPSQMLSQPYRPFEGEETEDPIHPDDFEHDDDPAEQDPAPVACSSPSFTATYSTEDNKIRLYASRRLDAETYARVKAAGFSWAPRQDLFVAPMWTPAREDIALELAGEIDSEESTMAERAEQRAERFNGYSDKRETEAHRAHAAVARIADGIPLGQPILIGHHSEKRARKDAERIRNGMTRAVRLWDTACFWEERAKGVQGHAEYKADPGVRARRIKGLEADKRKCEKALARANTFLSLWTRVSIVEDAEKQRALALKVASVDGGIWGALDKGELTGAKAAETMITRSEASKASAERWIAHLAHRLAYERVLLGRAPDEETPKVIRRGAKAAAPLLNYRAPDGITVENPYRRGETETLPQVEMTAAEYAKIYVDYKGTRLCGSHRVRSAIHGSPSGRGLVCVFLTDSKVHEVGA